METSIYRFTSFETFLDSVLRKELCLVHPTLWDDPKELEVYYIDIYKIFDYENNYIKLYFA